MNTEMRAPYSKCDGIIALVELEQSKTAPMIAKMRDPYSNFDGITAPAIWKTQTEPHRLISPTDGFGTAPPLEKTQIASSDLLR